MHTQLHHSLQNTQSGIEMAFISCTPQRKRAKPKAGHIVPIRIKAHQRMIETMAHND